MKYFLVDTNVLISFLTDRNIQQQSIISPYFKKASQGKLTLVVHLNVITELVYVLIKIYGVNSERVKEIIKQLFLSSGIIFVTDVDPSILLSVWPHKIKDWGDAVLGSYALKNKNMKVLSFDKKFLIELRENKIPFENLDM